MKISINAIDLTQEGLLLVNKMRIWILPGGKPEEKESDYDCLYREIYEELSVNKNQIKIYNYYNSFVDKTPFSEKDLEAKCYFASINGKIKPANEISKAKRIKNFEKYNLSDITKKIVNSLKQDKYL